MIQITSVHFKKGDERLIRKFANYVLSKFVRRGILNKSRVQIKVLTPEELKASDEVRDLKKYKAWVTYDGNLNDIKCFTVILNANRINNKGKKAETRLKNVMYDLGHELVHVKQYLNREVRDYVDGSYMFLGEKYKPIPEGDESEEYYDSPAEIEAYGREHGLYRMFWIKMKKRKT